MNSCAVFECSGYIPRSPAKFTRIASIGWRMPPFPIWFQGRAAIGTALSTSIFTFGRQRRLLPTRANSSPAFGLYQREVGADVYGLIGLVVLDVVGEQIGTLVAFLEPSKLTHFALPPTLPA